MRKHFCRCSLVVILFFCCIFINKRMLAQMTPGSYAVMHQAEEMCENEKETKEEKLQADWRFVQIFIEEEWYATIDLFVILGIMVLLFFVVVAKRT